MNKIDTVTTFLRSKWPVIASATILMAAGISYFVYPGVEQFPVIGVSLQAVMLVTVLLYGNDKICTQ